MNKRELSDINQICIHKSGYKDWGTKTNWKDAAEIKDYHMKIRSFDDIAYNFIIKKDGTLETGRDINNWPASCRGHNKNVIAICLIGEFLLDYPSEAQVETLTTLLAQQCKDILVANGIDKRDRHGKWECTDMHHIFGHCDYRDPPGNRQCPGTNLSRMLPGIAKDVSKLLG